MLQIDFAIELSVKTTNIINSYLIFVYFVEEISFYKKFLLSLLIKAQKSNFRYLERLILLNLFLNIKWR